MLILPLIVNARRGVSAAPTPARAVASNRNMLPSSVLNSASYVRHSRLLFTVPDNATFTAVRAYFPGFGQNAGGEFDSPDAQNIMAKIEYGGGDYPASFSGADNVNVTAGSGAWGSFSGLTLTPGTTFYFVTRAVGANTAAVNRLIGQGTKPIFHEGGVNSTDTGQNYVTGVYAKGAVANAPTVGGGNITACTVASGGTNYTAGPNVYAYEQQANGPIAWKTIGYANLTGGAVTSITVTSGTPPAGVAAWVSPTVIIGGTFSNNTAVYGPAVITGRPSAAVKSLVIHGTSIEIGWGSTDAVGDFDRNFGIYERGLRNRCGVLNLASPSQTYAGYSNSTTFAKTYALLTSLGTAVTHSLLGAPTNDVQSGAAKATVEAQMNTVRAFLAGLGHKVDFTLLLPRTSSTDSWATVANQTEATGFGSGGVAEGFNADVISGVMVSDGVGHIDGRTQFADGTSTRKWDVAADKTDDGIHPSEIGLWVASNSTAFTDQFAGYA